MKLIAAVDSRWGIGKNGGLLTSIPEDMRFFREATKNHILVMGHKTLLSFPNGKPLYGRLNITASSSPDRKVAGAIVCGSIEQLLTVLKEFSSDDIFVIGGGSIYHKLLPYCDTAYITKMEFDGEAEVFMPNLDELSSWKQVEESGRSSYEGIEYSFVRYANESVLPVGFTSSCSNMASYFKNKSIDISFIDFEKLSGENAKMYLAELKALLRAYFRPLENGFNSKDILRFTEDRQNSGLTLEAYLKEKRYIASQENFEAINKKYNSDNELKSELISINKEDLDKFDRLVDTAVMLERFKKEFAKQ